MMQPAEFHLITHRLDHRPERQRYSPLNTLLSAFLGE